jgi:hypothetical protein
MLLPTAMRRRPLLHLALAAAAALLGTSCLSPTLPLPPPDVESIQQAGPTTWTISGSCTPGAVVTVFDDNRKKGVVVEDSDRSGKFVVELEADACDSGWASQTIGVEWSSETPFVVAKRTPNDTGSQAACH